MKKYIELGKRIYQTQYLKEKKRLVVFVARCLLHKKYVDFLLAYFAENELKKYFLEENPYVIEQLTRAFFYQNSKLQERYDMIVDHFDFCLDVFKDEALKTIYNREYKKIILWESEYQEQHLDLELHFSEGERKEGLMTLRFNLEGERIYLITFWLGKNEEGKGVIYIGALQGMNGGAKIIKKLTKYFGGYRIKNLILYVLRCVAEGLGIDEIRAVSNTGFYANNHLRMDRKLKTDLDGFWQETGGEVTVDERFYSLPLVEYRKSMEEVVPHKRSQYRKRFAMLDELRDIILDNIKSKVRK